MKHTVSALAITGTLALGAGCVVGSGVGSAHADGPHPRAAQTLTLGVTFLPSSEVTDDVAPAGPSAGDRFVFAGNVTRQGKVIGRLLGSTVSVDSTYQGVQQSFTLLLPGGSLVVEGGGTNVRVPGTPAPGQQRAAVVGGTGKYAGARGTYFPEDVSDVKQRITITLVK